MVLPLAFSGSKGGNKWPVARIKNFWSKAEQPSFWPLHIPFCSPSARKEIPLDGNNDKKIFRKVLNKAELTEIVLSYWNYITDFNEENIEEEYQDMEKETDIEEINEEKADEFKQEKEVVEEFKMKIWTTSTTKRNILKKKETKKTKWDQRNIS
ncbi:uncharacterized protein LOC124438907 [Xenia sp. Carnegie-2017]|uniref:uncharacterized protein LOC124438907 n=1 Tax=Xenia sp. Carnegie-2017 TaxID=2897299 RepID=UPI001F03731B|nr:uncharacterized protein LOC124438907 [Xenia sp. Carnegie-2017]